MVADPINDCYLGVLALKHNKQDILTEVGIRIYEFEELFRAKYLTNLPKEIDPDKVFGLPKKDQLYLEVFHWRDEFRKEKYRSHRILDDAQEMMFEFIDEIDIDRFMFEVWHSIPANSPIDKEIEERFARKSEVGKLCHILKTIKHRRSLGQEG